MSNKKEKFEYPKINILDYYSNYLEYEKAVNMRMEKEKELLGKYPNTYTFTKALAERTLKKRIGKINGLYC
jgi:hypothetical protein